MAKLFIEDLDVAGKKVLVRVDFNVPLDDKGTITNDKRIVAALPTINYLIEKNAKVILMSHCGRPKGERKPEFSLKPVAEDLNKRVSTTVHFADDCIGDSVKAAIEGLSDGDVLLLENLRYYKEETSNDENFAKQLAELADVYVNDAFGTAHRAHASTEGVTKFIDKCASGYLLKKEIDFLGGSLENPERPFLSILGGAKVSDKIPLIENLLGKADKIIIAGGMAYTFYKAMGLEIGTSLCDDSLVDTCKDFLERGKDKIVLPLDNKISGKFDFSNMTVTDLQVVDRDKFHSDKEGLDIGPKTIEHFRNTILESKTIVWNGPMGVFECADTAKGTFAIAEILAEATEKGAITIIGGGDSASAIAKSGLSDKMSHISTGGGASLEFLEGKVLPGVAALTEK